MFQDSQLLPRPSTSSFAQYSTGIPMSHPPLPSLFFLEPLPAQHIWERQITSGQPRSAWIKQRPWILQSIRLMTVLETKARLQPPFWSPDTFRLSYGDVPTWLSPFALHIANAITRLSPVLIAKRSLELPSSFSFLDGTSQRKDNSIAFLVQRASRTPNFGVLWSTAVHSQTV